MALVGSVGLLAMSSVAQSKTTCNPATSKTLIRNEFARVYSKQGKVFVCLKSTGRTTVLKGAKPKCLKGPNIYICDRFALGGKWVAWTRGNPSDVDVIGGRLTVMYIPSRSVDRPRYPTARQDGEIYKIVLLSDGAAAWTEAEPDGPDGAFAVGVFGTDRRNHPIDRLDTCGASVNSQARCYIDASSLKILSGKTVGWKYSQDGSRPATISASRRLY